MWKTTLPYFLIPIFIGLGIIFWLNHYVIVFNKSISQTQTSTSAKNAAGLENPKDLNLSTFSYSKLSLPILMYHHIRDYSNPNDQIGTNLSVSVASFINQLDEMKNEGYETITFEDIKKGEIPEQSIILTFDDGYDDFYYYAFPELQKRNMKATLFVITEFIGENGYMNESQILEVKRSGIEIGSHTLSHPDLTVLNKEQVDKEIRESKKYLEEMIGTQIISFCYPSGRFISETEILVENAGYDFAVTTASGIAKFSKAFELSRYRIGPDTDILNFL